jgi:hypothetical protein
MTSEGLPAATVQESEIRYVAAGMQGVLAMKRGHAFMLPVQFDAKTGTNVVLESVTPGVVHNAKLFEPIALQAPRDADEYYPERGFSARQMRSWGTGTEPVEGAVVRTFGQGSPLGTVIVFHGEMTGDYAYVNGMWVEGTEDGEHFRDFVDGSWIFCTGYPITKKCKSFAEKHAFAPGELVLETAPRGQQ